MLCFELPPRTHAGLISDGQGHGGPPARAPSSKQASTPARHQSASTHPQVGYLEEEAVKTYTHALKVGSPHALGACYTAPGPSKQAVLRATWSTCAAPWGRCTCVCTAPCAPASGAVRVPVALEGHLAATPSEVEASTAPPLSSTYIIGHRRRQALAQQARARHRHQLLVSAPAVCELCWLQLTSQLQPHLP